MANAVLDVKGENEIQHSLAKTSQVLASTEGQETPVKGSIKGGLWNSQLDDYAKAAALPNHMGAVPVGRISFRESFPQCHIAHTGSPYISRTTICLCTSTATVCHLTPSTSGQAEKRLSEIQ